MLINGYCVFVAIGIVQVFRLELVVNGHYNCMRMLSPIVCLDVKSSYFVLTLVWILYL